MVKVGRETYLQFAPPEDRNSSGRHRSLLPKLAALASSTSTGGSAGTGEGKLDSTTASEVSLRKGNEEVGSSPPLSLISNRH
jgi:hypothetical protein